MITGYKLVGQLSFPAETVCHIWLPPRLLLLPGETTVHDKWLSAESVLLDSASYRDSRQEAQPRVRSRQEAIFCGISATSLRRHVSVGMRRHVNDLSCIFSKTQAASV